MTETDLLHLFIERVPHSLPDIRVFRRNIINTTATFGDRRVRVRNGIAGQGDAYAIRRGGLHVEIETKKSTGMRVAQQAWEAWCAQWGVPHLILKTKRGETSGETIARWIEELRETLSLSVRSTWWQS